MSKQFDSLAMGATLYVPATRSDLLEIVAKGRIPHLRSVAVCLEDAVLESDLPKALANLASMLERLNSARREGTATSSPVLLVRPRTPDMLATIVGMFGSHLVDGFVLPKATAATIPQWMAPIAARPQAVLPTIETREAFEPDEMRRLRAQLLAMRERVPCVRIGGNDLLQLLGARRSRVRTSYDGPLGTIIASLVSTFAPWGLDLSAPVLESFSNELLIDEVERDMEHGLNTKTAIHPSQIPIIQAMYSVGHQEIEEARNVLADDAPAVYGENGAMAEPATHRRWAGTVVRREAAYGMRKDVAFG
jgi:citrate lyase beta subunit